MNKYKEFSKYKLAILLVSILLTSCSHKFFPKTESSADFMVQDRLMQIRVSPYVNAMPGSNSNDVIIPITFWMHNSDQGEEWPRKFKITKVRISNVDRKYTQISDLDHDQWIHNKQTKQDGNALRIPLDIAGRPLQKFVVCFKDDKGKRYQVTFRQLSAGNVY